MDDLQKVRRIRLKTQGDLRRYGAWLLLQAEAGNICDLRAKTLNSILRTLASILERDDFQEVAERIDKLEALEIKFKGEADNVLPLS